LTDAKAKTNLIGRFKDEFIGADKLNDAKLGAVARIGSDDYAANAEIVRKHIDLIRRGLMLAACLMKANVPLTCFDFTTGLWEVPIRTLCYPDILAHPDWKPENNTRMVVLNGIGYAFNGTASANGKTALKNFRASVDQFTDMNKPQTEAKPIQTPKVVKIDERATRSPGDTGKLATAKVDLKRLSVDELTASANGLDLWTTLDCLPKQWFTEGPAIAPKMRLSDLGKDTKAATERFNRVQEFVMSWTQMVNAPDFMDTLPATQARKVG
jgi:hypothetical protein